MSQPMLDAARSVLAVSYDTNEDGMRECQWCANFYQPLAKPYRHERLCEVRLLEKYVAFFDKPPSTRRREN